MALMGGLTLGETESLRAIMSALAAPPGGGAPLLNTPKVLVQLLKHMGLYWGVLTGGAPGGGAAPAEQHAAGNAAAMGLGTQVP